MEALNIKEAISCRCGGQVKVFGPCEFAPRSHWGVYCSKDACQHMISADTLDEAIDRWNHRLYIVVAPSFNLNSARSTISSVIEMSFR